MSGDLFLIAGPNGAGKSTLYQTRLAPRFSGTFVNADVIQRDELCDASLGASYEAARIASDRRNQLLARGESFASETVFSHPSKLEIIHAARDQGYTVFVLHVGLETPDLSVARVRYRTLHGGHDVPEDKIRERYQRGEALIRQAVLLASEGLVYDNSRSGHFPKLTLRFRDGRLENIRPDPAPWIRRVYALPEKL